MRQKDAMSSKMILAVAASTILSLAAGAAESIDMNDPRRSVAREDNVRIDAQLSRDTASPGAPIGVTYQIQNFTATPVAIADKLSAASYDEDQRTITVSIGSEVPADGTMPHMVTIGPGEKKVLRAAAIPSVSASAMRDTLGQAPRYVQVKVTILRDLAPFATLRVRQQLSDAQFTQWMENSDTILLNAVPIGWTSHDPNATVDASQRIARAQGF